MASSKFVFTSRLLVKHHNYLSSLCESAAHHTRESFKYHSSSSSLIKHHSYSSSLLLLYNVDFCCYSLRQHSTMLVLLSSSTLNAFMSTFSSGYSSRSREWFVHLSSISTNFFIWISPSSLISPKLLIHFLF